MEDGLAWSVLARLSWVLGLQWGRGLWKGSQQQPFTIRLLVYEWGKGGRPSKAAMSRDVPGAVFLNTLPHWPAAASSSRFHCWAVPSLNSPEKMVLPRAPVAVVALVMMRMARCG